MDGARTVTPGPDDAARQVAVESGRSPVGLGRLWLGLLLAPGVWVLGELVGYYFAARSCEGFAGGVPLLGTAHPAVTHVALEVVAALAAIGGLLVALANLRTAPREGRTGEAPAPGRAHFMALSGVIVSVLFLFGIVLFGFSGFVVQACSQAR